MGDTLTTVIAIALAAILMFVFPLIAMADKTDDVTLMTVRTATSDFVNDVRTTGKLTMDKYSKYVETINSTGNTYDVEMTLQVLDENPGKKTTQAESTKIGENVYYTQYTSQILEAINPNPGTVKTLALKEGDIFGATATNTSPTLFETLQSGFYSITGNDSTIKTEDAGMVTTNGSLN